MSLAAGRVGREPMKVGLARSSSIVQLMVAWTSRVPLGSQGRALRKGCVNGGGISQSGGRAGEGRRLGNALRERKELRSSHWGSAITQLDQHP